VLFGEGGKGGRFYGKELNLLWVDFNQKGFKNLISPGKTKEKISFHTLFFSHSQTTNSHKRGKGV